MRRDGFSALIITLLALGGFGFLVWANAQPDVAGRTIIIPTQELPTEDAASWQSVLQAGFGGNATALPTMPLPSASFAAPTIPPLVGGGVSDTVIAGQVASGAGPLLVMAASPTPAPTAVSVLSTPIPVTAQVVTRVPAEWAPPALIPPISRDPLGRDHYWFYRPVDSNATNAGLPTYPYGSDGPSQDNPWRVHHGIDMPNAIGQTVRAAGSGRVVWAGPGFENSPSYGIVVVLEHDFGYNGQPLYTLYAHLSGVLVSAGDLVNAEEPIGLVGNTGRVSGAHVHFEVRMGENRYGATYNPILWMVPYVGHGVVAGRVTDSRGEPLQDQTVTLRDFGTGLIVQSTTSYIFLDSGSDVNRDPLWQENFAFGDVPAGRYEVITNIDGVRVSARVDVVEGATSFAELILSAPIVTFTPTPEEASGGEG